MTEYSPFRQNAAPHSPHGTVVPLVRPGNLATIIGRIEEAVDEETAAIRTDIGFDLKASNAKKTRYLYELSRAMKGLTEADIKQQYASGITRLRDKLARNEAALLAHLSAVGEVATLLQNAIRHAEADGTYSEGEFGWAR
jgi:hypothetical protein